MLPSIEHIVKKRHATRRKLRMIALILSILTSFIVIFTLIEDVLFGDWREYGWDAYTTRIAWCACFMLNAGALWLFDRALARRLVPMPRAECPGCRYDVTHCGEGRCSECGCELPEALIAGARRE